MARRLDRIRVEQDPRLPADGADLGDGLDGADLVVGEHDAHQAGVRPDGLPHLLRRYHAARRDVQQRHLKPLPLQRLEGVEHRVVLKLGGDDVPLPPPGPQGRGGAEGLVIRLAAAGGEGEFPGRRIQIPGKDLPGRRQLLRRLLAWRMETGGVAVDLLKAGGHRRQSRVAEAGGRGVVRINLHLVHSISQLITVV